MNIKHKSILFLVVLLSAGNVNAADNPFGALFGIPQNKPEQEKPTQNADKSQSAKATAKNRNVRYAGYSEKFQPVKQLMLDGDIEKALVLYATQYNDSVTDREETSQGGNAEGGSFLDSLSLGGTGTNTSSYDDEEEDDGFNEAKSVELEADSENITEEQQTQGPGIGSLFSAFTGSPEDNAEVSTEVANTSSAPNESSEKSQESALATSEKSVVTTGTLLGSVEQGILAIDAGQRDKAIEYFSDAEVILDNRKKSSDTSDSISGVGNFLGSVLSGDGEVGPYESVGFEKVLMLNYKSIAYMLGGDRKAYNVTRRSIEWQNLEKKKFQERLAAAQSEIDNKKDEQQSKGNDVNGLGVEDTVTSQYKETEEKALSVESAYVNPFGYYMAGVVQEFDSYEDRSLRSNALIAYKKALKLNKNSKVLKKAVKDLKKNRAPKNKRLVHIVLGDGLVPEKKMLRFDVFAVQYNVPIKLPIYEPVASRVARVEVQSSSGRKLSTFSPVADIEALALRHQKDSEPFQNLLVTATVIRSIFEKEALKQVPFGLGGLIGAVRDEMGNPDMRSWMTLPSSLQAVRMYLPKKQKVLQIVSFDSDGKELARKKIELDNASHSFVYARSIDNSMYVSNSNKLWVALK